MSRVEADDLPWTTAPEHAVDAMRQLDILEGSAPWDHIDRLATKYGLEQSLDSTSPTPASVAAGAIYAVRLLNDQQLTQADVSEVTGVSRAAIQKSCQAISDAEDIPHRGDSRGATVGGDEA